MGSSNDSSPYGQSLEISGWPITKANTVINIVPQGKRMVVERFGKLHAIHESGYFFAVPFVDSIAYVIDVRERAVDIPNQSAITRDNVSVEVSGNLFVRVADPERAAYGARNPLYAVIMVSWWFFHLARELVSDSGRWGGGGGGSEVVDACMGIGGCKISHLITLDLYHIDEKTEKNQYPSTPNPLCDPPSVNSNWTRSCTTARASTPSSRERSRRPPWPGDSRFVGTS